MLDNVDVLSIKQFLLIYVCLMCYFVICWVILDLQVAIMVS